MPEPTPVLPLPRLIPASLELDPANGFEVIESTALAEWVISDLSAEQLKTEIHGQRIVLAARTKPVRAEIGARAEGKTVWCRVTTKIEPPKPVDPPASWALPSLKTVGSVGMVIALAAALTLGGVRSCNAPGPNPVDPPGPTPTPQPVPFPPPIPGAGLRVLVVYESSDASKLDAAQQNELKGKAIADYLNAHCAVGDDGKTREWRIWDKDVPLDNAPPQWKVAMSAAAAMPGNLPKIVVSNGKTGVVTALPPGQILPLIQKYEVKQ